MCKPYHTAMIHSNSSKIITSILLHDVPLKTVIDDWSQTSGLWEQKKKPIAKCLASPLLWPQMTECKFSELSKTQGHSGQHCDIRCKQ